MEQEQTHCKVVALLMEQEQTLCKVMALLMEQEQTALFASLNPKGYVLSKIICLT